MPSIVAGLRVSAGLAWQSLVGAELIVASAGVGYMMVQAQSNVSTATVMAGMVAIGIVGLLIDVALRRVEARSGAGADVKEENGTCCNRFPRVNKVFRRTGSDFVALTGRRAFDPRPGVRRYRRPVRLRQDDLPAHGGRDSISQLRARSQSTARVNGPGPTAPWCSSNSRCFRGRRCAKTSTSASKSRASRPPRAKDEAAQAHRADEHAGPRRRPFRISSRAACSNGSPSPEPMCSTRKSS